MGRCSAESKDMLPIDTCRVEVQAFVIKMVMTAASVFVNGVTWLSIIYLVGFFFITYLYLR
jgi:hypothetical protein